MIRSGFGTHLNVQNRKMYAMVTLCAFLLQLVLWRCQNTAHFYWCLHTFVKYVECMQHFHEWVWLDRDLAHIWMCRIERSTQWLHSVHSCCNWCSDVVKILHISIGVFEHLSKICRVYAALSWVSMIRSGFGTHQNVQNRKMYAMVTLCAFLLQLVLWRCQNTAHFYWCLHTFVKYVECMQHFHEWVWLDRDLAHIWMCRIERCTQWLHSVHSCCNWCSDVVKILHISIGVCTPL